LDIYSLIICSI